MREINEVQKNTIDFAIDFILPTDYVCSWIE